MHEPDLFGLQAIGWVARADGLGEGGVDTATTATIRIAPEWVDQLAGLEEFSHLVVVVWLDRAEARQAGAGLMRPEGREDLPAVGAFAIRTPVRPNPIGLCYPKLIRIEGDTLTVTGLDFWHGTPILDLKGYFPRDEMRPDATVPDWLAGLWADHDRERAATRPQREPLRSLQTTQGQVVIRHSDQGDVRAALTYFNNLSREQTFTTFQGEQLTLLDELNWFGVSTRQCAAGDAVHIVAIAGDKVIGIAEVSRGERVFRHRGRLGISIAPDWRGLGLGRTMLELVLAEAERTISGLRLIQLECFATNTVAVQMYQKAGFVECGRLPGVIVYQGQYIDEIIMTRPVV
ncbi:MAG TPA: TrmO family methyltransferase [Thermomicrobiales bacterium]|nr:TrmO family methyltransferase [Thermomicrobiales bacterium]